MWDQQAAALGDRFRVFHSDTRGYGRSESNHVEFSNRADAAAVLDEVGEASAHIVGMSRGAHSHRYRKGLDVDLGTAASHPPGYIDGLLA